MIFVTVGTSSGDFSRLVKKMDEIAGEINEEVIIQYGYTKYIPRNARHFAFASRDEILKFIQESSVVVTHGASTIIDILKFGRIAIAVPRLRKYDEDINDHQLELCKALERQGKIKVVYNVDNLGDMLFNRDTQQLVVKSDHRLAEALRKYIESFDTGRRVGTLSNSTRY
jgi:UDP-N-acetylglucosamine transferase subunit ALG13